MIRKIKGPVPSSFANNGPIRIPIEKEIFRNALTFVTKTSIVASRDASLPANL
jgi:hypothetical protein